MIFREPGARVRRHPRPKKRAVPPRHRPARRRPTRQRAQRRFVREHVVDLAPAISAFLDPQPLIRQRVARRDPFAPVSETLELRRTEPEEIAQRAGSMFRGNVEHSGGPSTLEALEIASLGVPGLGLLGGGLLAGGRAAAGLLARDVATAVGKRVLTKTAPSTVARAGERAAATQAGKIAARAARSKPVRIAGKTAKGAGKAASFPVRHPLKTTKYSVLAQAPVALATGDPGQLAAPFKGEGVIAGITEPVAGALSSLAPGEVGENLVRDVLELPANTPPSLFMLGAAGVEGAQGDWERAEMLKDQYIEHGFLPSLLTGDLGGAAESFREHPLFAALEARGALAGVGRAAGAVARRTPGVRIGDQERAPLEMPGAILDEPRRFSPDLIEKGVQTLFDRRRERRQGGQIATPRERDRILRERTHRLAATTLGTSRLGREHELEDVNASEPRRAADADVVDLAIRRVIRSPETAVEDLTAYMATLDREAATIAGEIAKAPTRDAKNAARSQLEANATTRGVVERALREGDPAAVARAAEANVGPLRQQSAEMEELGLLGEGQGERAAAMDFAVTHMGARYGRPQGPDGRALLDEAGQPLPAQLLDAQGGPLPTSRILGEMERQGAEPGGFISQRPGSMGRGSYFRKPFPNQPSISRLRKTGEATRRGTAPPSFERVRQQRARNQQMIAAVKNFRRIVSEFSVRSTPYKTKREADDAARVERERGGDDLVAVKLNPLRQKKNENALDEAIERLDPEDTMAVETLGESLVKKSTEGGEGPYVLMHKTAFNELQELFRSATPQRRAAQLLSQTFKGAVLPLSPNWYASNFIEVNLRAAMEGTTPYGFNTRLASRYLKELEKVDPETAAEMRAGVTPGMTFGRAMRDDYHRVAEQFEGTALETTARVAARIRRAPAARTVADGWRAFKEGAFRYEEALVERPGQLSILGKAIREEVRATNKTWRSGHRITDEALREFIGNGKIGTPTQIRMAKRVERAMGQWTANSPTARRLLVDILPFGQWLRASSKLVYMTLPRHHPIKVSLMAMAAHATQEEREKLGLSYFAPEGERLPPTSMGSLPVGPGGQGLLPIQGMTTFGQFSAPFTPQGIPGFIFPQLPLAEVAGLDFTGQEIRHTNGTPLNQDERAGAAFLATLETFIPGGGTISRVTGFDPLDTDKDPQGLAGLIPRGFRPENPGLVDYLQGLSGTRPINIPVEPSSSSSSSSSTTGGEVATPWRGSGSSTSSGVATPWR